MRTIHTSFHKCPFPKPPPLLQATAVTPPGRKPIFPIPWAPAKTNIHAESSYFNCFQNHQSTHKHCDHNLTHIL